MDLENIPMEYELQKECYPWPPKCREYLEEYLLPSFIKKWPILFVWIAPYTSHYRKIVRDTEFITLDKFSFKKPDVLWDFSDSDFPRLHNFKYKTIIFNGIIWFWINTKEQIVQTFKNIFQILEQWGECLIGWNEYVINRDDMIKIINMTWLNIVLIEWKEVFDWNGKWSPILQHRYILTSL